MGKEISRLGKAEKRMPDIQIAKLKSVTQNQQEILNQFNVTYVTTGIMEKVNVKMLKISFTKLSTLMKAKPVFTGYAHTVLNQAEA